VHSNIAKKIRTNALMKRETEENKTLHSLLLDVLFVFLDGYVLPDCMDLTTNYDLRLVNQLPASPLGRWKTTTTTLLPKDLHTMLQKKKTS